MLRLVSSSLPTAGPRDKPGNTKGGSITVPLTSGLTGLDWPVLQIKTKIVSCHSADSKPVKHEVNSISSVFPGQTVFSGGSVLAEYLTTDPKFEGLNQDTALHTETKVF
jgi:hypothetical protein